MSVTVPFLPSSHIPSYSDTANSHNALLQHMVLLEQSAPPSPLAAGEFFSFSKDDEISLDTSFILCVLVSFSCRLRMKKVAPKVCQGDCLTVT